MMGKQIKKTILTNNYELLKLKNYGGTMRSW